MKIKNKKKFLSPSIDFTELHGIQKAMDQREVVGSLIDAYVGAYYNKLGKLQYDVQNIMVSKKAYGIVLGKR